MHTAVKIGLTYTGTEEKHQNYINWLKGDDHVEIVRLSPGETDPEMAAGLNGIVLSGGIDMHPKYYQNDTVDYPHVPEQFYEERDEFEIAIFNITQRNKIPLLGVCRGMQLINCVLGGTLTQDIGPTANAIHKFDQNDKAHGINIIPGTFLNEITRIERSVVNSAHHQCIKILGEGLRITCTSDDGIIEGVEWADQKNNPFFTGIQWHPERMYKLQLGSSPLAKNIRDHFIKEAKSIKNN